MVAIFIVIALLLVSVFVYFESRGFRIVRYSFVNDKLKVPRFRMAVISDLHDREIGEDNREVIEALEKEAPDAVFFAGDMVTSSMEPKYRDMNALKFIREVSRRFPLYYGIGNHEEKLRRCPERFPGMFKKFCDELEDMGVRMLMDEKVSIDEAGIDVYGLDLEHEYYRKLWTKWIPDDYLEGKFGKCDQSRVSVLIAHNPEQFDKYALWKPDYVLSGHVHGGIVSIPFLGGVVSPQIKLFPKYDAGLFESGGSTMILSRGLGMHTIPLRVLNKAEVIIVDIYKEDKEAER